MFAGDPAPFVMELPLTIFPPSVMFSVQCGERGWSLYQKAELSFFFTIVVWFTTYFGWVDGTFQMLEEDQIDSSSPLSAGNSLDLQAPGLPEPGRQPLPL